MMKIQGRIIAVLPLQEGVAKSTGNPWKKQEYVLETLDLQFPKKICFSLFNDKVDEYAIKDAEELTVEVQVESREYNGRWYTEVRGLVVERGILPL